MGLGGLLAKKVGNLVFTLSDQRIELSDFDGVVSLFVLTEPGQIRDVLRSPAMEELHVFIDDQPPDGTRAFVGRGKAFPLFLSLQGGDQSRVAPFTEMETVFGEV